MFFTDKLKKFRTQDVFEINNNLQLNDTNAKEVEVTFEFYRIGHINSTSGKFEASLIVQAKWFVDSRLEENSDIFDYNADKHWNPKLYIENEIATNNETVYRVEEVSDSLVCVKEYKILEGLEPPLYYSIIFIKYHHLRYFLVSF